MGHRLSRITTRTGDDGSTGLGDGSRVAKTHPRIAALGDTDELNSQLGLLLCEDLPPRIRDLLSAIQHDLFDLGGELAVPGWHALQESHLLQLDQALADFNAELPPLKEFILPGGSKASAQCHVARAVSRRAERQLLAIEEAGMAGSLAARYLNRLSDLLFVLARVINRHHQVPDVLWQPGRHSASEA